jgi:hypothetical protein
VTDNSGENTDENTEQTLFAVGAPWPWPDRAGLIAQEGFGWHPDAGNMLLIVHDHVSEQMVDDFNGPADLALLAHGPLVGLMLRLGGGWTWMETLAWRGPGQGIPEVLQDRAEGHLLFRAVLVDRTTGTIAAMRAFTVSAHFTKMLLREVADRWSTEVTVEEGMAAREEWNRRNPTLNAALKASLARSHGGD